MDISPWITTFSGRQFFVTRATPDDIYIEDIAHGLSNICRYVGQCRTFYSVAEHSVRMVGLMADGGKAPWSSPLGLSVLLHDAPEAYLNDVPSLVKQCLPRYKEMEGYLLNVIYGKYGIGYCLRISSAVDYVKTLDEQIRTPEVLNLFPAHDGWHLREFDYGPIHPWSHKKAEKKFLKMFHQLYKEVT